MSANVKKNPKLMGRGILAKPSQAKPKKKRLKESLHACVNGAEHVCRTECRSIRAGEDATTCALCLKVCSCEKERERGLANFV